MFAKATAFISVCLLAACATKQEKQPEQKQPEQQLTSCPEQRSPICTREYLPVCATRDTGIRCITAPCPSSEEKTYGNACTACADVKVVGHRPGACVQEPEQK